MVRRTVAALVATAMLGMVGCANGPGIDAEGTYSLRSTFQLAHGIPAAEAPALAEFLKLTRDPEQLEVWLLNRLGDEMGEPFTSLLTAARNGTNLEEEFRSYLTLVAPAYRRSLVDLADEIDLVTSSINLQSELELSPAGLATHELTGVWVKLGAKDALVDFSDAGVVVPIVATAGFDTHVGTDGRQWISLGQQMAAVPYGRLLNHIVNDVLVKRRDPYSDSLAEYLSSTMPCPVVGDFLVVWIDQVDIPAEAYSLACAAIFGELGRAVLPGEIRPFGFDLSFEGDAIIVESDDYPNRIAGFEAGEWAGTMAFPSASLSLRRPDHVFVGERTVSRIDSVEP